MYSVDLFRNGVYVSAEEPGVGDDGVLGQRLDPRPRDQRGPGLVERYVTVRSYTAWKKG